MNEYVEMFSIRENKQYLLIYIRTSNDSKRYCANQTKPIQGTLCLEPMVLQVKSLSLDFYVFCHEGPSLLCLLNNFQEYLSCEY